MPLSSSMERLCGQIPSSMPVRNTWSNSSPFVLCNVIGSVAVFEHAHVTGFLKDATQECGRFLAGERFLQLAHEFLERPQWGHGPARRSAGDKFFDGPPQRGSIHARRLAQRINRGLADAARRQIQYAKQRNVVLRVHGQAHVGQRIAHFGPLVEAESAYQSVTDPPAPKRLFKSSGLSDRTILNSTGLL